MEFLNESWIIPVRAFVVQCVFFSNDIAFHKLLAMDTTSESYCQIKTAHTQLKLAPL